MGVHLFVCPSDACFQKSFTLDARTTSPSPRFDCGLCNPSSEMKLNGVPGERRFIQRIVLNAETELNPDALQQLQTALVVPI
jgi:hypothetical protein